MISIDDIIARATESAIDRVQVQAFCQKEGVSLDDLYNRVAVTIARRFHDGMMSYEDADAAMNRIWGMVIEDTVRFGDGFELPEPAFSVYEAFDAGEYDHGDGADPVEKYTRPLVAKIIGDASHGHAADGAQNAPRLMLQPSERQATLFARMSEVVDGESLSLEPVRIGCVPAGVGTPARYVTVFEHDKPILRVDVYPDPTDCYPFQETIVWRGNLIVGFGRYVHAISLADRSTVTIALDSYFGQLYPTPDYLLLASGNGLFRLEPDRSVLWKKEDLGIDGVVVDDTGPPVVRGHGEWDTPGGWRPFAVMAADGKSVH